MWNNIKSMKTFLIVIGVIIAITLLGLGIKLIFFPVHTAEKILETAYDGVSKTINAENAIYNYEWFKQQKEDIEALGNKYDNSCITYDSYLEIIDGEKTFEDKNELARLNSVKLGIKNMLEQAIANYNARSKMANRNIFEDSILPDYLDALTFIKK